jgi:hypothetical protein
VPKRLIERCQAESIREFRATARQRFEDGLALRAAGQRTGAIYLWGYTAEMILKAAYFALIGLGETDVVTWKRHLSPAISDGRTKGIIWPNAEAGHNVRAWAELLVAERASSPATAFQPPLDLEVQGYARQIEQLWRPMLRYHKNFAYRHEVKQVHEAAEWFLVNSDAL